MTDTPKPLTKDEIGRMFSTNALVLLRATIAEKGFLPAADARLLVAGCQRLVATIEQQREQIEKLSSALERTERNFRLSVAGKPVRDMGENLAENATAIAATEQPK